MLEYLGFLFMPFLYTKSICFTWMEAKKNRTLRNNVMTYFWSLVSTKMLHLYFGKQSDLCSIDLHVYRSAKIRL